MIDLYTWPTPNGHKIHIMLEETGLEYRVHPIDIGAGDQFKPDFLAVSPNNKIPAMVDQQGPDGKPFALAESGAMLFYLASKTGRFLPKDLRKRWQVMQWVMTQMGHVGPMLGQAHHFLGYAPEKIEYAMNRYKNEANRLYGVLDRQLAKSEWLACDEYTIADMATMPWLRAPERQGVNIDDYPHVKRWRDRIAERPAVKKAVEVLAERRRETPGFSKEQAEVLFGAQQYARRCTERRGCLDHRRRLGHRPVVRHRADESRRQGGGLGPQRQDPQGSAEAGEGRGAGLRRRRQGTGRKRRRRDREAPWARRH